LADLNIKGKTRQVVMHAPKNGFFYVLDRKTGELLSADPWVTVSWASGVNLKTGRPVINPEARYGTTSGVNVMPGPGGGHVWPPWSFNPMTGLVYIPSQIGGGYNYQANPNFTPVPTDIGPTGRGQMNMGTGGRGNQPAIPSIGPTGRGSILVAWDPVAQKERWRGLAAGFNQGGSLSTGGNLVFSSVINRLIAYRADTGEQLLDLDTHLTQMGPPVTFMIDGKQYIAVAGGPTAPGGGGGRGGAPPAGPAKPSQLLT